ncbi:hypothetical protein IZ6_09670 [Terrihabitans soli]|uniref:DUF1499 domain-containing protein n=1 Tax=Terrihabitans soli TaxID=708113 RepID=A0A6S6QSI4_9HYPH|nr:DUF1499 domain-containing protein [Terrihabitans soli]BCJ90232.1 hypothetical protein IZ6_09670 [Terrihabitans soli]
MQLAAQWRKPVTAMMDEPFTPAAVWSRRLGIFAIPVAGLAVVAQRAGKIDFNAAVAALGSGMALAVIAILLGIAAFAIIWVHGNRGAGAATAGILAGILVLSAPAYFLVRGWELPALADIATDPANPPAFVFVGAERKPGENPLAYPGESAAVAQMAAYPDIQPLRVSQPPDEVHALALQLVESRGWRVLDSGYTSRRIEAVATSLILKMSDDVVITVNPDGTGARVDMRSASRRGDRDLGTNAQRIRAYLAELAAQAR